MTGSTSWSIGELAARAGVTVKTVRFYSDQGLLPETGRSSGGHRRYGPEALGRLQMIRSLRTLDLPVPAVGRALERDDALQALVADRLRELRPQLTSLRWREAALHLLADCSPEERARRLDLIGAMGLPPDTDVLARFWRRWLFPARLPAPLLAGIVDTAVPAPSHDPTPAHVLAFGRLRAIVTAPCPPGLLDRPPAPKRFDDGFRPAVLYSGLKEAYDLAAPELRAGRAPAGGEALDRFVGAWAEAGGARDSAAFRRRLTGVLADEPRLDHYWDVVSELATPPGAPPEPTPGAAEAWLREALAGTAGDPDEGAWMRSCSYE
ncbi:MerR family DNA-binding transcriptional regulator [Streptomyces sp. SID1328]|uniref:MerR family transcriptional regulator n=1 Tax=Streptomyces sp. SID1328 TaxID=2690250 RepID=UPI001370717E|nr:MerR family DNA-binding transcriptional regulator [Streptomyces sp. SID1328]MYV39940.1 MerR family DNA-binding transcriptional regulator [Streptomyces sp. SID1328]